MNQKKLTEDMPESAQDLSNRGLILDSGQVTPSNDQRVLTEDLPQEEDEETGSGLLTEDC